MSLGLRVLYLLSVFCAAACAAAHVLSFANIAFYPVLLLVPLLFVVWPLVLWQYRRVPRKNLFSEIFANVPAWIKLSTGVLLAYAMLNLFIVNTRLEGGTPVRLADGKLVLQVKGQTRRELSSTEFR